MNLPPKRKGTLSTGWVSPSKASRGPLKAAIALRYPETGEEAYDVREAMAVARFAYCVLHEDGSRFPESGWLDGTVTDLIRASV